MSIVDTATTIRRSAVMRVSISAPQHLSSAEKKHRPAPTFPQARASARLRPRVDCGLGVLAPVGAEAAFRSADAGGPAWPSYRPALTSLSRIVRLRPAASHPRPAACSKKFGAAQPRSQLSMHAPTDSGPGISHLQRHLNSERGPPASGRALTPVALAAGQPNAWRRHGATGASGGGADGHSSPVSDDRRRARLSCVQRSARFRRPADSLRRKPTGRAGAANALGRQVMTLRCHGNERRPPAGTDGRQDLACSRNRVGGLGQAGLWCCHPDLGSSFSTGFSTSAFSVRLSG